MMQHVIDVDRVREVDYLTGDDAYKRDWMSHSRERHGLVAYNLRTPRGLALAAIHLAGSKLKRLARRLRAAA
jgi:CelD/BcsL family acetyltransferase involved in cellulose biosynthesis